MNMLLYEITEENGYYGIQLSDRQMEPELSFIERFQETFRNFWQNIWTRQ